jgi:hypothetical protein
MSDSARYPTGMDIIIQPGDPMHPGGDRPAIAAVMFVSAADQQYIDEIRERSYRLAIERGHIQR